MPFTLHRPTADDWERFRELRLRMLADTPIAYGETLTQSLAYIDEEWQNRAAHANAGSNAAVVAVDRSPPEPALSRMAASARPRTLRASDSRSGRPKASRTAPATTGAVTGPRWLGSKRLRAAKPY